MGLFEDSAAALCGVFLGAAGQPATYSRDLQAADITAWLSLDRGAALEQSGVVVEYESWDWMIPAAALADFGEPERGDRITDAGGAVYEVLPPAGGERAFAWCDAAKSIFRVHTKLVKIGGA